MIINMDKEEYIEHFGVKGMRWGQRKAARKEVRRQESHQKALASYKKRTDAGKLSLLDKAYNLGVPDANKIVPPTPKRTPTNRELNKASRVKDIKKHDSAVDKARGDLASGKAKADLKKAKAEFKTNKEKLGSREARKILNKNREKHMNTINTAQQAKSGKETALVVLTGVGLLSLGFLQLAAKKM